MPPRFPIRWKLTTGALLPLIVAILLCWLSGFYLIGTRIVAQAQDRVRTDLNSAREVYRSELERICDVVKFTGRSPLAAAALQGNDRHALAALLSPLLQNEQLDFLTVVNPYGQIVFRAGNDSETAASRWSTPLVAQAIGGKDLRGTVVIPYDDILKENPALTEKAAVPILSTPRARHFTKKMERAGLFLVAAAPMKSSDGRIVGALYGGVLLNNNNQLVDRIKRILYEGVQFEGKDAGTVTIFLDDLRVATNVTTAGGTRAIGTLMSEEVYDRVILDRMKWFGRAFVVDDWDIAAYEPILDLEGKPVGSLYVGMAEKPYLRMQNRFNLIYAGILLFGSLVGIALSWHIGSRLARPVRQLEHLARRMASGEREVRFTIESRDEIGELAGEFEEMARSLVQREEEIRELNRELERKVQNRTAELEEKNRLLVKTREDLVRAEKLAAVGELAAGVAHEINNPMAIIRGNAELLQMAIPDDNPSREEVEIIVRQVGRVERIVAGLLKFARPEPKRLAETDINRLLDEVLVQLGDQVPMTGVLARKNYAEGLPPLPGDPDQLRQVLTNLLLNAVQAMAGNGTLTVVTRKVSSSEHKTRNQKPETGDFVEISVIDTGVGIAPESLGQLFNPFFTTRADGTGLGLSVSYGIVRDHGGTIDVESQPGNGATFRVILPISRKSGAPCLPA
jgi:two-component system NtrC family sensor kinase